MEFKISTNQKPSEETLKRLSELKDEDIVYDEDCPELTPKMQKALASAVEERDCSTKTQKIIEEKLVYKEK